MSINPFTTVLQKAIIVAGGVLLILLGTTAGLLWWDLRSARADLETCRTTSAGLGARLDVQNGAVLSWQQAASSAQETTRTALEAARRAGTANKPELKRLADLLAAGRATDCGPAVAEIREGLR